MNSTFSRHYPHRFLNGLLLVFVAYSSMVFISCETEILDPSGNRRAEIYSLTVQTNPGNALSASVTFGTRSAASARAIYWTGQETDKSTPVVSVGDNLTTIPLLGLKPSTVYSVTVRATGESGDETESEEVYFSTGPMPDDMPTISILYSDNPSPGYVMFGFTGVINHSYAVIIDNTGNIVWYKRFESSVSDFVKHANGAFTASVNVSSSSAPFLEFGPLGNIVNTYRAGDDRETRPHELHLENGAYALLGNEYRTMDLTALGGRTDALVTGIVVEYIRPNANPLVWKSFDYMEVSSAASDISLVGSAVNPWHGNAIEIDTDGNLLVSFRNSDLISKIHSTSGEVLWRLGGKENQFQFINDPLNGFSHQHAIRRLSNGNIILFDNGNLHTPQESRAVEYALDEQAKTATMVWEYKASPPLYAQALGFAQRLNNGNTLITFGTIPRVIEVDAQGNKRWELTVETPRNLIYRARKIDSLY